MAEDRHGDGRGRERQLAAGVAQGTGRPDRGIQRLTALIWAVNMPDYPAYIIAGALIIIFVVSYLMSET